MLQESTLSTPAISVDFLTPPPVDIPTIVQECVTATGGDLPAAARLLEERAKQNPALLRALTAAYLPKACWAAMRQYAMSERCEIWRAPNAVNPDREHARVRQLARANAVSLFDFRLPISGCPKLGDATREMVEEACAFYQVRAVDMLGKAAFLRAVAGLMKGKKTVRAQLKLEDIQRCHDAAICE